MSRVRFQLKIRGPKPDEVSAGYLGDLLKQLEESILSFAQEQSIDLGSGAEPALSLVDVEEGSDLLTFSMPDFMAPAIAIITGAVATDTLEKLPRDTHAGLYKVSEKAKGAGWGLEFLEERDLGIEQEPLQLPNAGFHHQRSHLL